MSSIHLLLFLCGGGALLAIAWLSPASAFNATGLPSSADRQKNHNETAADYDDDDEEESWEFEASNLTQDVRQKAIQEVAETVNFMQPKMYYYDQLGYLIIDGRVPGTSEPIPLDLKKYANTCTSNVHFFFTFVAPDSNDVDQIEKVAKEANFTQEDVGEMLSTCPYGITFCYEGQLDGDGVREEFRVQNFISSGGDKDEELAEADPSMSKPSHKISLQCMAINGIPNAHGFNMAVVAFPGLEDKDIKGVDKYVQLGRFKVHWRFFVLTLSISEEEYYFMVPDDGRVMLQIGDRKSLRSYFTDSEGNELPPVQFEYQNETYGTLYMGDPAKADPYNMDFFEENRGLWLLYMDFKRRFNELQVVNSVHSEDCEMQVEIRGNRMRKCRAYLEDIVVTEASDADLDFVYTSEVGSIKRSDQGQEDIQEMVRKKEKEEMRKTTTKTENTTKSENQTMSAEEQSEKKIHEQKSAEKTSMYAKASAKVSAQTQKSPLSGPGAPGRGGGKGGGGGLFKKLGGGGKGGGALSFLKQSAQQFGGKFLEEAGKNGLLNDAMKMLDDSPLGKIKKDVMQTVDKGVKELNNLKEKGEKIINQGKQFMDNQVNKVKQYGENMINKGKGMVENVIKQGKDKVDELQSSIKGKKTQVTDKMDIDVKNIEDRARVLRNSGKNADADKLMQQIPGIQKEAINAKNNIDNELSNAKTRLTDQAAGYKNMLQQKGAQLASSMGGLVAKSYDAGNGMVGGVGKKIGQLAAKGPAAFTDMVGSMQNMLPGGFGGAMRNAKEKVQSMLPGGSGNPMQAFKSLAGNKLGEFTKNLNLPGGQMFKNGIPNLPTDGLKNFINNNKGKLIGLKLPDFGGVNPIKMLQNGIPNGIKMPSSLTGPIKQMGSQFGLPTSFDAIKKNIPGLGGGGLPKVPGFDSLTSKLPSLDKFSTQLGAQQLINSVRTSGGSIVDKLKGGTSAALNKITKDYNIPDVSSLPVPKNLPNPFGGRRGRRRRRRREAGGTAEGEAHIDQTDFSESEKRDEQESHSSDCHGERMFSDVTKSKSLSQSFKSTTGVTDTMTTSEFVESSQAFTKKESVDITVSGIPKGKKVILSQLMFECDGNVIKLPKMYFHDGEEELKGLSQNVMGSRMPTITDRSTGANNKNTSVAKTKPNDGKRPKRSLETERWESMMSKYILDDHTEDNNYLNIEDWHKLTLAEKVAIDPSILFEDDDDDDEGEADEDWEWDKDLVGDDEDWDWELEDEAEAKKTEEDDQMKKGYDEEEIEKK